MESLNLVDELLRLTGTAAVVFLTFGSDSSRFARKNACIAWDRTTWEYVPLADSGLSVMVMNSSCKGLVPGPGWVERASELCSPRLSGLLLGEYKGYHGVDSEVTNHRNSPLICILPIFVTQKHFGTYFE